MLNLFQKKPLLKLSRKDDDESKSKDSDNTDCMDDPKEERQKEESRKKDQTKHMPLNSVTDSTKSVFTLPDLNSNTDKKRATLSITLSSAKRKEMQKQDVEKGNGDHFVQKIVNEKNEQISMADENSEVGDSKILKSNSENILNENVENLSEMNQQNSQTISSSKTSVPSKESDKEAIDEVCKKSKSINETNFGLSDMSSLNKNPIKGNEVVGDTKYKLAADEKPKSTGLEEKSDKVGICITIALFLHQWH